MAHHAKPLETWDSGSVYEPYVGRWSRLIAKQFLAWLNLGQGLRWMDIGCGTGALSFSILEYCNPVEVMGIDPSKGFLRHARETLLDDRVTFYPGSAEKLPSAVDEFDAAVSGLVLNFLEDQEACWDAAIKVNPAAAELDEGKRFPICHPDRLKALFESAGLREVETTSLEVPTVFHDFMDYWSPFVAGQAPAPAYCTSLPEDKRQALRDELRKSLPMDEEGHIHLKARAYAVKGKVAG